MRRAMMTAAVCSLALTGWVALGIRERLAREALEARGRLDSRSIDGAAPENGAAPAIPGALAHDPGRSAESEAGGPLGEAEPGASPVRVSSAREPGASTHDLALKTADKDEGEGAGDGFAAALRARSRELGGLTGAQRTSAMEDALEAGDLGLLEGILISSLTLKGTELRPEDLPLLVEALAVGGDDGLERLLLTHLERIDAPAGEKALGYLDYLDGAASPRHASEAFEALQELRAPESVPALLEMLRQPSNDAFRSGAAETLARIGDERAVPALLEAARGAETARETRAMLASLARMGSSAAATSVIDFVSRSGNEASLRVLRELRAPDAAPQLAASLNSPGSEAFQRAALDRLRQLGDPRTVRDLVRFLERAPAPLVRSGIDALSRVPDRAAARALADIANRIDTDPRVAAQARRGAQRVLDLMEREAQQRRERA